MSPQGEGPGSASTTSRPAISLLPVPYDQKSRLASNCGGPGEPSFLISKPLTQNAIGGHVMLELAVSAAAWLGWFRGWWKFPGCRPCNPSQNPQWTVGLSHRCQCTQWKSPRPGHSPYQTYQRTKPLHLVTSNHREYIQFHLIFSPLTPIVLGQSWLIKHNPHFDWSLGKIVSSPFCLSSWLQFALARIEATTSPSTTEPPDLTAIPTIYYDLGEVFSKQLALSLPPHRPYDCTIDLLPGAPLPSSRLFNLSWKRGYGEIYPWLPSGRYYLAFVFPCWSRVLLCGQKRLLSPPLYRFLGSQCHHSEKQISSASD